MKSFLFSIGVVVGLPKSDLDEMSTAMFKNTGPCEFLNSSSILRNTHIVERFKEYMKGE